ncbi:hypothetical protein [Streptomyces sp. RP5T]|uniref:hypothetical protein n=1 Tax=Streptomyces sp. RP5T TaxID=2490848 RepID=UPI000F64F374|nr:hypothetical protein [Streptomyces sp. RP5T]RRR84067.1 hypothetical protein EHS43_12905 [Streptomyces sp. RP5T]
MGLGLAALVGDDWTEQGGALHLPGPFDTGRGDVAGIDDGLGGQQLPLGELIVDSVGQLDVLDGGDGGGDMDDQFGAFFVAGFREVRAVSAPGGVPFNAVVRVGVVGRAESQRDGRQRVAVPLLL